MAIKFEHNGQKYMITDDMNTGYRIHQDAHSNRELYIEATREAFAVWRAKTAYRAATDGWVDEVDHQADMDEQDSLDMERPGLW
jgi:hypothetical protein